MITFYERRPLGYLQAHSWHIGDYPPYAEHDEDTLNVEMVRATGEELKLIRRELGLACDVSFPIVRFYGEQAKFIAGNLHMIDLKGKDA